MCMMAPATATRSPATEPAPALNIQVIDAHIEQWRKKAVMAPDRVCRAMADGHVSALQTVRVIHGLPMLPETGEAVR